MTFIHLLGFFLFADVLVCGTLVLRFRAGMGLRNAALFVWAALACGSCLWCEVVSTVHALAFAPLYWAVWGGLAAGLTVMAVRCLPVGCGRTASAPWLHPGWTCPPIWLLCLLPILLLTFLTAIFVPSVEMDVLTYHLPRVCHWLVNGDWYFYPTAIARQNYQPPGHGAVLVQLFMLAGPGAASIVQWISFPLSAAAVSLLAAALGASRRGQIAAAFLALVLPASISQSISAVDDLFAAVFVATFCLPLVRAWKGTLERFDGVLLALAFGAALLAKFSTFPYLLVFGLWFGLLALVAEARRGGVRACARRFAVFAAAAIVGGSLLVPHVSRNLAAYGSPFSGEPPGMMTVEHLTPANWLVNFTKHAALNLGLHSDAWNERVEAAYRAIFGGRLDDPAITYAGGGALLSFVVVSPLGQNTSFAGNPLQFLLGTVAFLVWLACPRRNRTLLIAVAVPVLAVAALFAVLFKWQPYSARLQIPAFLLLSAGLGCWLESYRNWMPAVILFGLGAYGVVHLSFLRTGVLPMTTREILLETYPVSLGPLFSTTECLASSRPAGGSYGLLVSSDNGNIGPDAGVRRSCPVEYLLWALSGNPDGRGAPRFRHLGAGTPNLAGWIVSDRSRESVLRGIPLTCVLRNPWFACYRFDPPRRFAFVAGYDAAAPWRVPIVPPGILYILET